VADEETPSATAPSALPRAMFSRLKLEPSSAAKATSAPRPSITAMASGFISFERARSSATLMIFWAAFSFSMAFPFVDILEWCVP
jgi:hypothetical protein